MKGSAGRANAKDLFDKYSFKDNRYYYEFFRRVADGLCVLFFAEFRIRVRFCARLQVMSLGDRVL